MALERVSDGVHRVAMGQANAYLIDGDDGLTLIDAGFPDKEEVLFSALRELGRPPEHLKHLVLTHGHPDHIGSAAAIVRKTGALTYLNAIDRTIVEAGGPFRPMTPAPGLFRRILCGLLFKPGEKVAPVAIDRQVDDGETLPIAGGLEVIHVPGHCAGQIALLSRSRRMLFAADVFMNMLGLGDPIGFEDLPLGRASQRKLAALDIDTIVFGHGKPMVGNAKAHLRKWTR